MGLKIVPTRKETPAEAVVSRVKSIRPDCILQCNRCGSRTSLTTTNGAFVKNGRKQGGTVIDKDVCADCWRQGITVEMLPELKSIK